jgi:WD40 repeat protein
MFWRSKLNIALLVLPIILLIPLFSVASWRPQPISGVSGPAHLSEIAAAIGYSPNGTLLCASGDGTIQVYQSDEKSWVSNPQNGRFSGFKSGELIDPSAASSSGTPPGTLVNPTPTQKLRFSGDGKLLFVVGAFTSTLPTIQAIDTQTLTPVYSFGLPLNAVFDISPDGKWAAFGRVGSLVLLDLTAAPFPHVKEKKGDARNKPANFREYRSCHLVIGGNPNNIQFSPDSKTLAVAFNHEINLFDIEKDLLPLQTQTRPENVAPSPVVKPRSVYEIGSPRRIEWSPDGSKLAIHASTMVILDSSLKLLASAPLVVTHVGEPSVNADIVWTKDGRTLFTGGHTVSRWRLDDSGNSTATTLTHEANYKASGPIALSPDGKYLLTSTLPGTVDRPYLIQWRVR